jgi:hypothetical protein
VTFSAYAGSGIGRYITSAVGDSSECLNDGDYSSSWRTWSSNSLMKVRLRMSGMRSR